MTFDNRAAVKKFTLTFWPKLFGVNIHVEKQGKNLEQKVKVKFFTTMIGPGSDENTF